MVEGTRQQKILIDLWTYCYVRKYFLIKFLRRGAFQASELDQLVEKTYQKISKLLIYLDKNIINYPTNVPVQWGWYNDSASNLSVNQVLDINGNYLRIKSRSGFGRGFGEEKFVFPNKAPLNYSSNVKKGGSRKNKSRRLNLKYRNLSKKIMKKTKKYN